MTTSEIIEAIDSEIEKLLQARTLLIDAAGSEASVRLRDRPKGSPKQGKIPDEPAKAKKAKRSMSAEGKARIAAAQKTRWAAQRKVQKPAKRSLSVAAGYGVGASAKKTVKKAAKSIAAKNKAAAETPVSSIPAGSEALAP